MTITADSVTTFNDRLYGSRGMVLLREFVTNSGLFWSFDALMVLTVQGVDEYVHEPAHWMLLMASIIQTVVISKRAGERWWLGNFVAPVLYTALEFLLEGMLIFKEPYHIVFWVYAIGMALAYVLYDYVPFIPALMQGIFRTALLPLMYMVTEEYIWIDGRMTMYAYWIEDSGHLFMLSASLLFGLLLGFTTLLRDRFERLLREMTVYLEQVTNWAFDSDLIAASFEDDSPLSLQQGQRTILFMDIRGFTPWSESCDPVMVVQMLNEYYSMAESIVDQHDGFKIQLMGDEIMTRFSTVDVAVHAASVLCEAAMRLLEQYLLEVGIGIHTGDVIEGMIGSRKTRQYGIIGDTVNTAARLQSVAAGGEIVLSEDSYQGLSSVPAGCVVLREQTIILKGKASPAKVYVLGMTHDG